ncbi:hypothetical protein [Streptomyces sp. NBC_00344]|uniref:hypothetical protein n=1 Tax=Streptomyces sp. NBC_00344 TaxID=2975720 RepID=UPI002E1F7606
MMPATLTPSHALSLVRPVETASVPLSAPLSRSDDAEVIPSPCMTCGAEVEGWGWINYHGRGVLVHEVDEETTPCPVSRPIDWATGNVLPSITLAGLSTIEWVTALYCSDYTTKSRPQLAELIVLIGRGLDLVGYEHVAQKAVQLQEFWAHCENNTDTPAVWDTYCARFDRARIMQASYEVERNFRALNKVLSQPVGSGVAA